MAWKSLAVILVPAIAHAAPCEKPDAPVWSASATDATLTACFGDDAAHRCLALDLVRGTWAEAKPDAMPPHDSAIYPSLPSPDAAQATYATNIRVCALDGKDCHVLTVAGEPSLENAAVMQNADRSRVVLIGKANTLSLFDGKTEKLVAAIPLSAAGKEFGFDSARFVGDALVVFEQISAMTMGGRIFDARTGAPRGIIGKGAEIYEDLEELGHGEWLFHNFYGNLLFVQNLGTGKLVSTIVLTLPTEQEHGLTTPFIHVSSDRAHVVAMRGDAGSGVVVYDVKSRKQTRIAVPACK